MVIAWFGLFLNHFARIDETLEKTHNLTKINLCRHKADQITTMKLVLTVEAFSSWRSPPVTTPKEVVIASFNPCEKN